MRIQHNISALNSYGKYTGNANALSKNLTKLSSGYRINSAADDAAGLAISEKMRSQIKGLEKAQDNANDGISLIQTAEGALTEVNSMLTRLTELATQSANGTYDNEVDRLNIQEETEALLKEIDRISEATNFNGITLLDGSLSGKSQVENVAIDVSNAVAGQFTAAEAFAESDALDGLKLEDIGKSIDYTATWKTADGTEKTTTVSLTFQGDGTGGVSTTPEKNYFTDAQGNKFHLDATNKTLAAADIEAAVVAGLKGDEEFNAAFEISGGGTDPLTFTAKEKGTKGATMISTGTSTDLSIDTTTKIAGGGTVAVDKVAANAMQKFDVTKLSAARGTDTAEEIEAKIFEIDGHKFLLANTEDELSLDDGTGTFADTLGNALTDIQRKALADDITVIEVAEDPDAEGGGVTADAAKKIAAEVSRVTGMKADVGSEDFDITTAPAAVASNAGAVAVDGAAFTIGGTKYAFVTDATGGGVAAAGGTNNEVTTIAILTTDTDEAKQGYLQAAAAANGTTVTFTGSGTKSSDVVFTEDTLKLDGTDLELQVGDTNDSFQKVNVVIQDMSSDGLGLTGLDLSNQEAAGEAITTIKAAVNKVSTQRGQLGALQNRLDHTVNNLVATTENITASESRIRDVDMAKEMTQYSKNNILLQASQSMLAQANQMPQGVLQLLQ